MTQLKAFNASLVPLLEAEGFKKRSGEIFTRQFAEGFIGWVGFNRARYQDSFELNPVVGVRCQEVEKLLSIILKAKPHSYIPPTVSISIGYLMPDPQFRTWRIRENNLTGLDVDIVAAIVQHAVPFMTSACTLQDVERLLDTPKFTIAEYAAYRRPLVKWLLGDHDGARCACAAYLLEIDARRDLAAENFRQFTRDFELFANQADR
jgi:hypothetical protein